MLNSVVSADGTVIGFESIGDGPGMVLVHGATADRTRWAPVRERLAERYTVHAMDRRGRGLSANEADTYDIQREGEDVAAVAEAVGGDAYVVAHSYGALCALHAALVTDAIGRMVLYEPPVPTPEQPVFRPEALPLIRTITDPELLLEASLREALRVPQADVDAMKGTAIWRARLAAVHTIVREFDQVVAFSAIGHLSKIDIPVRLFLGTESPAYLHAAAEAVAGRISGADVVHLHGQAHQAMDYDPDQFIAAVFAFDSA